MINKNRKIIKTLMLLPITVIFLASCNNNNNSNEPIAESLTDDSWETFCYYANKGEESFKKAYKLNDIHELIGPYNVGASSMPTLEREVKLTDGRTATVRLIGINHDNITNESNKKALFTFEFVDTINLNSAYQEGIAYGYNPVNVRWEDSLLRDYTNKFINLLPTDLSNNVKTVDKITYNYREDSENSFDGEFVTTQEKAFPLSAYEIAGEEDLMSLTKPTEGQVYEFYQTIYAGGTYQSDREVIREKEYIGGEFEIMPYWLRSPYFYSVNQERMLAAYVVTNEGSVGGQRALVNPITFYNRQVAPAFCI